MELLVIDLLAADLLEVVGAAQPARRRAAHLEMRDPAHRLEVEHRVEGRDLEHADLGHVEHRRDRLDRRLASPSLPAPAPATAARSPPRPAGPRDTWRSLLRPSAVRFAEGEALGLFLGEAADRHGRRFRGAANLAGFYICIAKGQWLASSAADSLDGLQGGDRLHARSVTADISPVDLPEHDVERAEDGRDVGQHVPAAHEVHGLEMREARRADLAAVRLVGAVGDEIDAELALGRLDRGIDLAGRHVDSPRCRA